MQSDDDDDDDYNGVDGDDGDDDESISIHELKSTYGNFEEGFLTYVSAMITNDLKFPNKEQRLQQFGENRTKIKNWDTSDGQTRKKATNSTKQDLHQIMSKCFVDNSVEAKRKFALRKLPHQNKDTIFFDYNAARNQPGVSRDYHFEFSPTDLHRKFPFKITNRFNYGSIRGKIAGVDEFLHYEQEVNIFQIEFDFIEMICGRLDLSWIKPSNLRPLIHFEVPGRINPRVYIFRQGCQWNTKELITHRSINVFLLNGSAYYRDVHNYQQF